jgi:ABC-type dipeptide/oligopeptide/nickel transport system permease component
MGLSFTAMKNHFAFRSVLAPILQAIAFSARLMVAELIVIERLFNWPGLGKFIGTVIRPATGFSSATVLTPATMAGLLTALVLIFLVIDFTTLFIARAVDPRLQMDIHAEGAR